MHRSLRPALALLLTGTVTALLAGIVAAALTSVALAASAPAQLIERVSVDSNGLEGNAASVASVLSADGQTHAFSSYADNLVTGDTNGFRDVFVRDAATLGTVRVSLSSTGLQADGASYSPSLSGDGRFLAFTSEASNLVPGDTNGVADVFVHDRDPDGNGIFDEGNGVNVRVSVDSSGLEADGASYGAYSHTISNDGRLVVFRSDATNLVAGDGNGVSDIFAHDRISGATRRVSVDSSGAEATLGSSLGTISGNGAVVAFHSDAPNLVPGDNNGVTDVFTHDLVNNFTTRASVDSSGLEFSGACTAPALSADGGVIAFRKELSFWAGNTFDICVRDSAAGSTQQITGAYHGYISIWSHYTDWFWRTAPCFPALSADGNRVAYLENEGSAHAYSGFPQSSFNAGVTASVMVFDRSSQTQVFALDSTSWAFSDHGSAFSWAPFYAPAMSNNGSRIAFESDSSELVAGDTNGARDAFTAEVTPPANCAWTLFCSSTPNSTGAAARITVTGNGAVAANDFDVVVQPVPNTFGMIFYSAGKAGSGYGLPFGNGLRCVGSSGNPIFRTAPVLASGGTLTKALDFTTLSSAGAITAGSTWNLQAWFRDPAAGGAQFDLSNAVEVTFQ